DWSAPAMYLFMKSRHSFMPGSLAQVGSDGSLTYAPLMMPTPFSGPAGFITAPTDIDTFDIMNIGFHARSCTLRMACADIFGSAATIRTSAPDDFRICSWLSAVGSVAS